MPSTIAQIALVTTDFYRAIVFYEQVLGLDNCFGTVAFRGPLPAAIQQLPNPASKVRWFTDDSELFQLEIFEFEHPQPKPLPLNHGVRFEGYNHLLIATENLERIQEEMVILGFLQPFDIVEGNHGRHGLTTDPDGNTLQFVERPDFIQGKRHSQLIGLGLTTRQFDTCVNDFSQNFPFQEADDIFDVHQVWQEQGQLISTTTLLLNNKYLVISEYANSIPRQAGYRLSDEGIMNFAVGYPDFDSYSNAVDTTAAAGMNHSIPASQELVTIGGTYCTTNTSLSVEMLFCLPEAFGLWGFGPPSDQDRTNNYNNCISALNSYAPSDDKS
jgi:catechol 2,3-dioxygenase-like lactoylglutathione lyase family enzyme